MKNIIKKIENLLNTRDVYKFNKIENKDYIMYNIWANIYTLNNLDIIYNDLIKDFISINLIHFNTDILIPDIILCEDGTTYNVCNKWYDKDKEFFSFKINK